jgi:hypothetical protein
MLRTCIISTPAKAPLTKCAVLHLICAAALDAKSGCTFGQALRGHDAAALTARLAAYQLFQIM